MVGKTALVIIDVQVGMFNDTTPIFEGELLLERIDSLLHKARQANVPVIFVQNCGGEGDILQPGAPGFPIHPKIAPRPDELVVTKQHPDAFQDTRLQSELERRGVRRLVVAGLHTAYCIDTSCRRAFSLGYDVTLVQDAHSTHDSTLLPAEKIIRLSSSGWRLRRRSSFSDVA